YAIFSLAEFITSKIRAAVKWDRANNPRGRLLPHLSRRDLRRGVRHFEFSREMEAAAPAGLALEPDSPADHPDQAPSDRESQSRSPEASRRGAVRLRERM